MTIYYSATTNAFYDSQVYNVNNIPEDKVAVSASTYTNLMAQQCAGRVIVAAADGTPTTIAQTCGSCTSTKYATKTELTNGLAGKANDNAVVHKSGNETINGVKSFGDIIKATNGTVQVGADTGYSVTFNYNGNITSKQARGTYNIFFPEGSGTLALTSDINGKANDSDVVHKTGDETIAGTKTFSGTTISNKELHYKDTKYDWTDTSLNVWCDAGNVAWFDKTGNRRMHELVGANGGIWKKSCYINENPYFSVDSNRNISYAGISFKFNGKNVALDENLVHKTGREVISGDKVFQNTIFRTADITTSTVETVYRFEDTNAKPCGSIYNKMHWYNNNVYNRHQSYNATSGKDMYFEVLSDNDGSGVVNTGGSVTNNKNLTTVTNATGNSYVATMGWVNNPATSTNVVHRSGDEYIDGDKVFRNSIIVYDTFYRRNNNADVTVTPTSGVSSSFAFLDKNSKNLGYIEHIQRTSGVNDIGIYVADKNSSFHGIQITSNNEVLPVSNNTYNLGSVFNKWANVYSNEINTKYFTYTHDNRTSYSYLPKTSGTLAIQERTRASSVVENRTLLYEFAGGLDKGDITLNDVYTKFNALLIVYSDDDGDYMSTYYLDCAELDIRREVAGSGTFLLVDGHSYWACTGASTGFKFVHATNNGLRIHKIYGLAKYY